MGLLDDSTKDLEERGATMRDAAMELVDLRRHNAAIRAENSRLRKEIEDDEDLETRAHASLTPEALRALEMLSTDQLINRTKVTMLKYREEKQKNEELSRRIKSMMNELSKSRGLRTQLEELEKSHVEHSEALQHWQEEAAKLPLYKATAKKQEEVIKSLEVVLEKSLKEVQDAQTVQLELERTRGENFLLNQKVRALLDKVRKENELRGEEIALKQQIAEKDAEIIRLTKIIKLANDANNNKLNAAKVVPRDSRANKEDSYLKNYTKASNSSLQNATRMVKPDSDDGLNSRAHSDDGYSEVGNRLDCQEADERLKEQLSQVDAERIKAELEADRLKSRMEALEQEFKTNGKSSAMKIAEMSVKLAEKDALLAKENFAKLAAANSNPKETNSSAIKMPNMDKMRTMRDEDTLNIASNILNQEMTDEEEEEKKQRLLTAAELKVQKKKQEEEEQQRKQEQQRERQQTSSPRLPAELSNWQNYVSSSPAQNSGVKPLNIKK